MSVAGIGDLRFCSHRAVKHAPLSHVFLCVNRPFFVYVWICEQ